MKMTWKTTSEELKMAQEMLENMEPDGYWNIGDMISYRRDGDKNRLVLLHRIDEPAAEGLHNHYKGVIEELGWVVDDGEADIQERELDTQEQQFMHQIQQQQQLMNATCENESCEAFIAAMELEKAVWTHLHDAPYMDEDGVEQTEEIWSPVLTCYACETKIYLAPDHFALLAGDDIANTYRNGGGHIYRVMQRKEVLEKVDTASCDVLILGTFCPFTQEVVPPFYRGLIMEYTGPVEEEE
jgi:hypothetical protein